MLSRLHVDVMDGPGCFTGCLSGDYLIWLMWGLD
jgi:hypothetical protein